MRAHTCACRRAASARAIPKMADIGGDAAHGGSLLPAHLGRPRTYASANGMDVERLRDEMTALKMQNSALKDREVRRRPYDYDFASLPAHAARRSQPRRSTAACMRTSDAWAQIAASSCRRTQMRSALGWMGRYGAP